MERKPSINLENKIQGVLGMWRRRERIQAHESGHYVDPIDSIPQDQEIVLFPQALASEQIRPPVMPSETAHIQRRSMRRIPQDGKRS